MAVVLVSSKEQVAERMTIQQLRLYCKCEAMEREAKQTTRAPTIAQSGRSAFVKGQGRGAILILIP